MKTKLFTLLFALILSTGSIFADGVKIGDLYYLLDKEKLTATVTYKSKDKKTLKANKGWDIQMANIPTSVVYKNVTYAVTAIGYDAFSECSSLSSVTIPNTVKIIGIGAFSYCRGLTSITIPNGVTSIQFQAFCGCSGLTSASIPNSVTTIEDEAFYDCSSLTSITIPSSVTSIGEVIFSGCRRLTTVLWNVKKCTYQKKNGYVGPFSYEPRQITSFVLGKDVEEMPYRLCKGMSSLTSVIIPENVKYIGSEAFQGCTSLSSISIPNSVTYIGSSAFKGCTGLASVAIPNSVTYIDHSAFEGCTNLTFIAIPEGTQKIGGHVFDGCTKLTSITIPNTVTYIYKNAFEGCNDLTIYTSSDDIIRDFPTFRTYKVPQDKLKFYYPYSVFAKDYVEQNINEWQKKGEFERVSDWQKRVNEQTRKQKIQTLLAEAQSKYLDYYTKDANIALSLGKYDPENEVFAVTDEKYGALYVSVPLTEAESFKNNWNAKTVKPRMQIYNDEVKLSALTIAMPNGKQYTYRNTDAVTYNLAELDYNFDPIELDLPKTSPAPKQGSQNITTTKVKVGKSAVDTDIPDTKVSNPNTFVVIFANEDYKNVASVPFAKNDGSVFQKYCRKTLGVPASNIHYVENATLNDMSYQLTWLKDVCDAYEGKASVIVYYAGHGIPDEASKSAYLLPVDGYGSYVQSAYKLDDMYQKLGAMKAKSVTVFMDACFSGSKREEGMLASARGVAIKAKSGVPQGNMVVFSAASGEETAYPNNDEQHGMFTYYLLKKLQETKGDVTLQALGNYITTNVRQQSIVKNGKSQTPTVTPSASVGTDWQTWKLK